MIAGHRRRAAACALPVALLWVSTLALRFHYAVDVAAGLVLAGCCLALAAMLLPRAAPSRFTHAANHGASACRTSSP